MKVLPGRLAGEYSLLLAQVNPGISNPNPGELSMFGLSDLTLARDAHQKRFTPYAAYAAEGKTLFHNAFSAYAKSVDAGGDARKTLFSLFAGAYAAFSLYMNSYKCNNGVRRVGRNTQACFP